MYIAYSNSAAQGSHYKSGKSLNAKGSTSIKRTIRFFAAVITLVVILSFSILFQVNAVSGNSIDEVKEPVRIVVEQGDTLWAIASAHLPKGKNVRSYIEIIKRHNRLDSSLLKEGQLLVLP